MSDKQQSFSNHAQYTPVYHFFTSPLALVFAVWTIVRFVKAPSADTGYFLVGALALIGVVMVSRLSPLRVQDRLAIAACARRLHQRIQHVAADAAAAHRLAHRHAADLGDARHVL